MSLLDDILQGLEHHDPAKAAQLRAEVGGAAGPQEPDKPTTILDELREVGATAAHDAVGLLVSEIPQVHEVPVLLGMLVKRFEAIESASDVKQGEPAPSAPAPASEPAKVSPEVVAATPAVTPAQAAQHVEPAGSVPPAPPESPTQIELAPAEHVDVSAEAQSAPASGPPPSSAPPSWPAQ